MEKSLLRKMNQPPTNPAEQSWQNMENILGELQRESRYKREVTKEETLVKLIPKEKKELGEYYVRLIRDPKDPAVRRLREYTETFGELEIDPDEIEKNVDSEWYCYFILENEKNEPIGFVQGSYLEHLPLEWSPSQDEGRPDKSFIFMGYIFVDEKHQRKGLSIEMNQSVFDYCLRKAKNLRQEITGVTVEVSDDVAEKQVNKLGMKCLYYEDQATGDFVQLPYVQPPLLWDKDSGLPIDPKTRNKIPREKIMDYCVPEHLTLRMIDGRNKIGIDDLEPLIVSIYEDNYLGKDDPEDETTPQILESVRVILDELKKATANARDGKILLLSLAEREAMKKEGKIFHEVERHSP